MTQPQTWHDVGLLVGDILANELGSNPLLSNQLLMAACMDLLDKNSLAANGNRDWAVWLSGQIAMRHDVIASSATAEFSELLKRKLATALVTIIENPSALSVLLVGETTETDVDTRGWAMRARVECGEALGAIGDPRPGVGTFSDCDNKRSVPKIDWRPVVPGGRCRIACTKKCEREVQPFFIARFPVTIAQYDAFLQDGGGHKTAPWWNGLKWHALPQPFWRHANHPRTDVTWWQAVAFARWLTKVLRDARRWPDASLLGLSGDQEWEARLPTEWEWQWAAQGGAEKREYPWGEESGDQALANTSPTGPGRATAVGMYPQGKAICEAEDMSGGVWEWCLDQYEEAHNEIEDDSTAARVLRGGSFYYPRDLAACASRLGDHPASRSTSSGFGWCCLPTRDHSDALFSGFCVGRAAVGLSARRAG
jgi:hypothetical protein